MNKFQHVGTYQNNGLMSLHLLNSQEYNSGINKVPELYPIDPELLSLVITQNLPSDNWWWPKIGSHPDVNMSFGMDSF